MQKTRPAFIVGVGLFLVVLLLGGAFAYAEEAPAVWKQDDQGPIVYFTYGPLLVTVVATENEPQLYVDAIDPTWPEGLLHQKIGIYYKNSIPTMSVDYFIIVMPNKKDNKTWIEQPAKTSYDVFKKYTPLAETLPINVQKLFLGFYGIE